MDALLVSVDLGHRTPSFVEQELTLALLRSLAGAPAQWEDSMAELGVNAAEASRLLQALRAQAGAVASGIEGCTGARDATVSRTPFGPAPATPVFAQANISDLVASALSIVAATLAAPAADAPAADAATYRQGFSVTHINHVAPPQRKDSDALSAYRPRSRPREEVHRCRQPMRPVWPPTGPSSLPACSTLAQGCPWLPRPVQAAHPQPCAPKLQPLCIQAATYMHPDGVSCNWRSSKPAVGLHRGALADRRRVTRRHSGCY